jgi:formate dehydrogenase subunit beta
LTSSDVHIATTGLANSPLILATSEKGKELLEKFGFEFSEKTDKWVSEVSKKSEKHAIKRATAREFLKEKYGGLENFSKAFEKCIECHNCMRVCPVCYCRRCYFESEATEFTPEQYLSRAAHKGAMRFSPDTLLFQIGRMSHMTTSCVSCGMCEDACPVDIPVSQLFALAADDTQKMFDYVAGKNVKEELPFKLFIEENELPDVERLCRDPLEGEK